MWGGVGARKPRYYRYIFHRQPLQLNFPNINYWIFGKTLKILFTSQFGAKYIIKLVIISPWNIHFQQAKCHPHLNIPIHHKNSAKHKKCSTQLNCHLITCKLREKSIKIVSNFQFIFCHLMKIFKFLSFLRLSSTTQNFYWNLIWKHLICKWWFHYKYQMNCFVDCRDLGGLVKCL